MPTAARKRDADGPAAPSAAKKRARPAPLVAYDGGDGPDAADAEAGGDGAGSPAGDTPGSAGRGRMRGLGVNGWGVGGRICWWGSQFLQYPQIPHNPAQKKRMGGPVFFKGGDKKMG